MVELLNPEKVISELPLEKEMSIADFGCGSGGWVIPLAKKSKDAKIYAIDVLREALSALKGRLEMEKVYNIRTVLADLEKGSGLADDFLDLVLLTNILFQVDEKEKLIKEAHRTLRRDGMLLLVDWEVKEDDAENKADKLVRQEGFKKIKEINAGEDHFAYLYKKE